MLTTILSSIVGKIAIAGVALATTTGGLAAADVLPAPAQQAVSNAAARIGISLPAPDDTPESDEGVAPDLAEVAPDLPEDASDNAKSVTEIVFGGDPQTERFDFGRAVSGASEEDDVDTDEGPPDTIPGPPDTIPGPPDQIPAGPPSNTEGHLPSPSSPRP
ncbi:MAG: hypothetical protein WEA29_07675 [Acidimicrobiia bacterium]